ncbi:conserved hypothetical protein [Perkinsus marinus ATCC 50983]|uniref:Peptidase M14 domain-containing protein n=1 Tax=Perkinsus marinus (strain ATCC 50983 / TXsc) TaxID=423536 RepID=C5K835_PERM5|nr:conserved hypothetical protein [Perkinsus marinus ATCC 50983]EER19720.1 conserved hypothetical protein [Perkinsus marinus ATCC 50983]|eukprot:XP_002787924.1 conserved hypothetical protein [Perkinsus marinus ATCC 50983]
MSIGDSPKIRDVTIGTLTFSSDFDSGNTCTVDYDTVSNTPYLSQMKAITNALEGRVCPQITWANNGSCSMSTDYAQHTPESTVYFAMCYPFGYEDLQLYLQELEDICREILRLGHDVCFSRELLTRSLHGRRVDVLTITSSSNEIDNQQGPSYPSTKPVILLTARVHPGETPGQFALLGALNFVNDPRAVALRYHYDLKFVPMINPDGVYMGNYRTNSRGLNLNRFYHNPGPEHEAVMAIVDLARIYAKRGMLELYVDMHGHANKTGCFL